MNNSIPLNPWPSFSEDEISSVSAVLRSGCVNYWTGPYVRDFEREFSDWIGISYSVGHANGTLALENAYRALSLPPNSEVITTPRTFIATTSALVNTSLVPIFADVDRDSGNVTAATIEPLITSKTKAISVVHLAGWPADMLDIKKLANAYSLYIIEDCSQAHGAYSIFNDIKYPVGSFGDIATWSFCQDKIISTGGEGGMIATNNMSLYERVWSYKDHGKSRHVLNANQGSSSFKYVHDTFGSNYRMNSIQAVLGHIQLGNIEETLRLRRQNFDYLNTALSGLACLRQPLIPPHHYHSAYKYYAYINPSNLKDGWSRDRIINAINASGFPAYSGSCSTIYKEKAFSNYMTTDDRFPVSVELGQTSVMFLVHPTITLNQLENYAAVIKHVLVGAQL